MPATVLSIPCSLIQFILTEVRPVFVSILQMKKPRFREVQTLVRDHTASKCQSWDLNPGWTLSTPKCFSDSPFPQKSALRDPPTSSSLSCSSSQGLPTSLAEGLEVPIFISQGCQPWCSMGLGRSKIFRERSKREPLGTGLRGCGGGGAAGGGVI